jgi:hypothetical protein
MPTSEPCQFPKHWAYVSNNYAGQASSFVTLRSRHGGSVIGFAANLLETEIEKDLGIGPFVCAAQQD